MRMISVHDPDQDPNEAFKQSMVGFFAAAVMSVVAIPTLVASVYCCENHNDPPPSDACEVLNILEKDVSQPEPLSH